MNDEPHFVFIVPVFALESRQHGFESRRLRIDINYVGGHITAARFQAVDLCGIGRKNLISRRLRRHRARCVPTFISDAEARKISSDLVQVVKRAVLVR